MSFFCPSFFYQSEGDSFYPVPRNYEDLYGSKPDFYPVPLNYEEYYGSKIDFYSMPLDYEAIDWSKIDFLSIPLLPKLKIEFPVKLYVPVELACTTLEERGEEQFYAGWSRRLTPCVSKSAQDFISLVRRGFPTNTHRTCLFSYHVRD